MCHGLGGVLAVPQRETDTDPLLSRTAHRLMSGIMAKPGIPRIAVIDQSPVVREGLSRWLSDSGYTHLDLPSTAGEITREEPDHEPALVIIGQSLAEHEALAQCRAVINQWPGVKIIVVSASSADITFQVDAVLSGASACLSALCSANDFVEGVAAVLAGYELFPRDVLSLALNSPRLTSREQEILRLIAAGHTDREIATRLGLSFPTVRNHAQRILEKLAVHDRREALRRAQRLGWVSVGLF